MSTIALLALFLAYIIAPTNPITWGLLIITFATLAYDTISLIRKNTA